MGTTEEIALRLAAIQDELLALPAGPSERRYELLMEQDALRAAASEFAERADEQRSSAELTAELEALRNKRKSLVARRKGYVMSKGGDSAGPASAAWVRLSKQSRAASGVDRLSVRITQIEDELAARREEEPDT